MSEFEPLFRDHRIDLDTLIALNEDDLRELELPLGDRKRILAAISRAKQFAPAAADGSRSDTSERRQLVAMSCDLVDSTRYATHLDPEDLRDMFHSFRETVMGIIRAHHGLPMVHEGDAIKAYFGSRMASEDDQENALSAAIAVIGAVSNLNLEQARKLEVRIGISTGMVVIERPESMTDPEAFGGALHLAARLEALADPGTVLVDYSTRQSMNSVFEFSDRGIHTLKGFDHQVHVWELTGKHRLDSRFEKRYRHTPLVGRERERKLLIDRWTRTTRERRGTAIVISGEAGIGKSRLTHELRRQVEGENARTLLFQCSPYHTDSVFHPILETLAAELGLDESTGAQQSIEILRSFLSGFSEPVGNSLEVFVSLFSLETSKRQTPSFLSESLQEEISRNVLTGFILGQCRDSPLLLLVEDVQWIDAASAAFFRHLAEQGSNTPMLMVLTSRQAEQFDPESLDTLHVTLDRLNDRESLKLMTGLDTAEAIPDDVRQLIERKAEGIPLFIEELTSTILEGGLENSAQAIAKEDDQEIKLSGILQSSLISRLDRLGESKEVAQLAATIGREFTLDLLREISALSEERLTDSLQQLQEGDVIYARGKAAANDYQFRHALIQDTARNLLPRERRESTHRRIAEVLEHHHAQESAKEPELVAYHYFEGRDYARAADKWLAAGIRTARTWAKREALIQLNKGLGALLKLPDSSSRLRRELDFQLEIGDVMYASFGHITEGGESAYRRALEIAGELDDHGASIRAMDGLFGMHFNSGHFDRTLELSDRLILLGKDSDNLSALVLGMQFKGMSEFCLGHFVEADGLLSGSLQHIDRANEVGSDFPSMALIYLAWTRFIRGRPTEATNSFKDALTIVKVQEPYRKAACLGDGCLLYAMMNDRERVVELANELAPLAQKHGFNLWLNFANFFKGWCAASRGDPAGLDSMEQLVASMGDKEVDRTAYLGLSASACIDFERFEQASAAIDAGLDQVTASEERYYEAELLRLKARLTIRSDGDSARARELLDAAIRCARDQSARAWEQRALEDLESL